MRGADAASSGRRALLIGIDRYRAAPTVPELEGCVNDVRLMRDILEEQFGFLPAQVTLLADEEATRDAILAALDALVEQTRTDDVVVIHYAGHGSRMTDREGDEASGLDSTIMPVDSEGWSGDNRDITDDELHLRLVALGRRTSFVTLIVDACHSATITRDAFGVKSRGVRADTRPIDQLPPSPIPAQAAPRSARRVGPSGWVPLASHYVLIAGCRDEETSFEYRPPEAEGRVAHGALTYFLAQELRRATPGTSYRDVFERAAARVTANNARQHPQMEGRADRAVFGVVDLEPMRFARVVARTDGTVTLAGGAAHGMTVGSIWSVHPQGTKHAADDVELGTLEITAVRAVRADARVIRESTPDAITADARAVEREHAYGTLRLAVQLAASAEDSVVMRAALAESRLLEVVADDEVAAARVYLLQPRTGARAHDPVPQLGALPAPTWAVVGGGGELLMPAKPLRAHAEVRAGLDTLARHRQALALENPSPDSALRGRFTLELLRRAADGAWVPATPERAGGLPVFEEGEAIAFEIASRHEQAAYVNLLDFGPTGSVSLLFPAPGATDQLEAGVGVRIGTREDAAFELTFPDDYPFTVGDPGAPLEAVETVKLFVTTTEADFRFLEQDGTRSAGTRAASALQLLWQSAAGGGGTRDIARRRMPVDLEDWTTVMRPFVLRRRPGAAPHAESSFRREQGR